jgi:thiopurine S-methyltransferase
MEFWHNRWQSQNIGWHREIYNDLLLKHWPNIDAIDAGNVFVPLCGKSLDMLWLAERGYTIVGLEMVQQAVENFFSENQLEFDKIEIGKHKKYWSHPFTIFQGDFFDLDIGVIQADSWYDRAALIAIEPSNRENYVDQIRKQTKLDAVGLLITFAYPQEQMQGPPYALHDDDVTLLFSDGFELECLEKIDLEDDKDRNLTNVSSSIFKIRRIN